MHENGIEVNLPTDSSNDFRRNFLFEWSIYDTAMVRDFTEENFGNHLIAHIKTSTNL